MERADNTARILDVKYHLPLPANERVGGPLDYFSGRRSCARSRRSPPTIGSIASVKPWLIADLLILKDELPRFAARSLWQPGPEPSITSLAPMAVRARPSARPAPPARKSRTAAWMRSSSMGCTSSSKIHRRRQQPLGGAIAEQYPAGAR
jgi:hypothetical protein